MRRPIALALAALLAGCVSVPTNQVLEVRGPKPQLDAALALAQAQLRRTLRDFDSVKDFTVVGGDVQAITATNLAYNFEEAWMLCVEFNARNAYGGYTGLRQHGFPMRLGSDGQPYIVGTTNWRTYRGPTCQQ